MLFSNASSRVVSDVCFLATLASCGASTYLLFSSTDQALGTRAYEASQDNPGTALIAGSGTGAGGVDEDELSADYQLLCQIGNCLQLDSVSLG